MRRVARPPNGSRVIFSCTELAIFDTSRSNAPKLALVPGSGGGSGYPSHPLSILMRLAKYLYMLYIYVVVLSASWHKS